MSLEICDCSNITLGDIGRPGCKVSWKVLSGMIFMFTKDSDGNRNKIDIADTLDQAYLDAKINHVDPTKRWYLTGQLYTIEGERAESNKFEASNGDLFKLSQGVRNRKAEVLDQGPELMEEYVKFGCPQISFFDIDEVQNLRGSYDGSDLATLYPIRVQKGSVDIIYFEPTADKVEGFSIAFNIDPREKDEYLRTINKSDIAADLLGSESLLGVTATYSNITATTVDLTLSLKYGSFVDPVAMEGLVTTDIFDIVGGTASSIRNETTSTAIPVTAVEISAGVYQLTFAAQTATNIMSCAPLKDGFNFSSVPDVKFAAV
jgi:hypothetical protein